MQPKCDRPFVAACAAAPCDRPVRPSRCSATPPHARIPRPSRLLTQVRTTLEMLRDANVRTWMLTGDKMETAKIVAQNASLVQRHQPFYPIDCHSAAEARQQLNGYPQVPNRHGMGWDGMG